MPEPALERELANLDRDPRNLAVRLERARDSARRIWSEPRLRWFTDHTPDNHSKRVVQLLSQTLEHLQSTPSRLQPVELFLLLASCYLHDIGMQDLKKNGLAQQDFTPAEWDLVRDEHPSIVREWIVTRTRESNPTEFRIDLHDEPEPYLELLGLICQGHGSKYFSASVEALDAIHDEFDGARVRGPLLTALLMYGDELDINRERARGARDEHRDAHSELHHTVNGYATSVKVAAGSTEKQRHATIELSVPEDDESVALVVEWLGRKLSAQTRRANVIVEPATNGELQLDPRVTFRVRHDTVGLRSPLGARALGLIEEDVFGGRVLRRSVVERMTSVLTATQPLGEPIVFESSELGDHADVLRWLHGAVRARGGTTCVMSCGEQAGRGPVDVLDDLTHHLGLTTGAYGALRQVCDEAHVSAAQVEELVGAAAQDLAGPFLHPVLLDIREIDTAAWQTRAAVVQLLTQIYQTEHQLTVTITLTRGIGTLPELMGERLPFSDFDEPAVADYLENVMGYSPSVAAAEAQTLMAVGQGTPLRIVAGLDALARRDREVVRVA